MKATKSVALVLLAFGALAAVQDEPLQVWLLILAPWALIAIAMLLHLADGAKADRYLRSDARTNHPWGM